MNENTASLPRDLESEQAIVCIAMVDPGKLDAIEGKLEPGDFFDRDIGKTYRIIRDLYHRGEPVGDPKVVADMLVAASVVSKDRVAAFLGQILSSTAIGSYATFYAARVAHAARLRDILKAADESSLAATDPKADPIEIAEQLDAKLASIMACNRSDSRTIGEFMGIAIERIAEAEQRSGQMGHATGLRAVDEMLGGLFPGELVVLAARPGIGKTALALQISRYIAGKGNRVLFVSLEMSGVELASRCLCSEAQVSQSDLRTGKVGPATRERLTAVAGTFTDMPLEIWDPHRSTPPQIRAAARITAAKGNIGLVVVDYIGLVRPAHEDRGRQRHEQVSEVTRSLKSLSKELACPVMALSQVNREAAKEKVLQLHHLRESGAIEQDADQVWMLQRNDDQQPTLDVAKNRHGDTGSIPLRWDGEHTRFADIEARDMDNYEPAFDEWS